MPDLFRGITRIQDADDFAGSLTNDYYLKYSSGTGKFSLQPLSVSPGGSSGQFQYNNAGSFGGAALVTYATSGTILTAAAGATTDVPLVVNGVASQSGDLQQWKVNGTALVTLGASGVLSLSTIKAKISNGTVVITDDSGSATRGLTVQNTGGILVQVGLASQTVGIFRGYTSQSATLLQLQGQSSTTAGTAQADIDTAWVDSIHATRKARLLLRAYDTAAREGLRIDADGTYALTAIGGGAVTASAALTVKSPTTTYVPLVVDSPASQSADLQQWKVNGTLKAKVDYTGAITAASITLQTTIGSNPSATLSVGTYNGEIATPSTSAGGYINPNNRAFQLSSTSKLVWTTTTTNNGNSSYDCGLARSSAGVIKVTDGSTGSGSLELGSGGNIVLSTTTGTKIGTGTTQLLGFYNATPVDQPATVTDPTGGATIDAEARTAIIAVIDRLQELGLIA